MNTKSSFASSSARVAPNTDETIGKFQSEKPLYERFSHKLKDLLKDLMEQSGISIQNYESRVKSEESLRDKINNPEKYYHTPFEQITDLIGLRIICYYTDDVEKIAQIIKDEFNIDTDNSVDKRAKTKTPNEFGYQSLHYIASLSQQRSELSDWQKFKHIKFEIQIRTVLQHNWAAIEHKLNYKSAIGVPQEVQRMFFQLSAILEVADEQFMRIKNKVHELDATYSSKIIAENYKVEINKNSISEYLENSQDVKYWFGKASEYGYIISGDYSYKDSEATSSLIRFLNAAEIDTLEELNQIISTDDSTKTQNLAQALEKLKEDSSINLNAAPQYIIQFLVLIYFSSDEFKDIEDERRKKWVNVLKLNHFHEETIKNILRLSKAELEIEF